MTHRAGDILIAEEESGFAFTDQGERLPPRLQVEADITWIDRNDLWVRLPEVQLVFEDQAFMLPSKKIKLPRRSKAFSWRTQAFEPVEASSWEAAPFYAPFKGRRVTMGRANYYAKDAWDDRQRSLGAVPEALPSAGLAGYAAYLGVDLDANRDQVLEAFRLKVKKLHPDAGGDPEDFKRLLLAREALLLGR